MAFTIPALDKREYLLGIKFPDAYKIKTAIGRVGISGINGNYPEELREPYKNILEYEKQLRNIPDEEIDRIYEIESEKRQREMEKTFFFNQADSQADYTYWAKMQYWTIEEAIALTFGKSPEVVTLVSLKSEFKYSISPFYGEYFKLMELAKRAVTWKKLYDPVLPILFLKWVDDNEISFPEELRKLVSKYSSNIIDWKKKYEEIQENYSKLQEEYSRYLDNTSTNQEKTSKKYNELLDGYGNIIDKKEELIKKQADKIDELQKALSSKPVSKEDNKPEIKPKKRRSLNKLILGMAINKYRYNPTAKQNSAISNIEDTLVKYDIPLDKNTIRDCLSEAYQDLKQDIDLEENGN